ncbi:MAG: S41 family peptidase [Putridiphycobacter sp.]|nr:S41 family peptidase [Putridiphycobacter sp.]
MRKLLAFLIFLLSVALQAQSDTYQIDRQYSQAELEKDFDIFWESIQEVHPSLYEFIAKDSLNDIVAASRASIQSGGELYLYQKISNILSKVGCGHTVCFPSHNWYAAIKKSNSIISFTVKQIDGELYIWDHVYPDSLSLKGLKIKSINSVPTEEVINKIIPLIAGDGFSSAFSYYVLQRSFRSYYAYSQPFASEHTIAYYTDDNEIKTITLPAHQVIKTSPNPAKSELGFELAESGNKINFYLKNDRKKIALIDIDAFERSKFKRFYKTVFESIAENNITNLIIDLRNNGGGYFPHGNELLTYLIDGDIPFKIIRNDKKVKKSDYLKMPYFSKLTKRLFNVIPNKNNTAGKQETIINYKTKKKNFFRGKVYVLINGGSFSMSCYVASNLRQKTKATFIGQETGGGKYGSNAILSYNLTLPHTNLRVILPHYHCAHQYVDFEKGFGVIPDIETNYTIQNYLNQEDLELSMALSKIENK